MRKTDYSPAWPGHERTSKQKSMIVNKELNQPYLHESGFVVIYFEIESVCTIQTGWFLNQSKNKSSIQQE
jgi:hypothetical protein